MPPRLTFSAISKQFGRYTALHPLTLSLEPGEILGFLGPNGAGKTTAIHLAMGFLHPSSGSGSLLGRPFGDAEARARLGFVPDAVSPNARWYLPWRYARWRGTNPGPPLRGTDPRADGSTPH